MIMESCSDLIRSDLVQIADSPVSITSTSGCFSPEGATGHSGKSPASELVLVMGLLFTVGTGGFFGTLAPPFSPSSSQISVETRSVARRPEKEDAVDTEDVSAPARLLEIRKQLSLNVKQLADAMQVGRPAVYNWLQGGAPREAQQVRLKELLDIAREWSASSDTPVGKFLITPLNARDSLMGLLRLPVLDRERISQVLALISRNIRSAESRKLASGYRSAASAMRELGIEPASKEVQQQRVDDASNFG